MPFKSKAQQGFMFANMPKTAKKWAKETPNTKSLPKKVAKKAKKKESKKKKRRRDDDVAVKTEA